MEVVYHFRNNLSVVKAQPSSSWPSDHGLPSVASISCFTHLSLCLCFIPGMGAAQLINQCSRKIDPLLGSGRAVCAYVRVCVCFSFLESAGNYLVWGPIWEIFLIDGWAVCWENSRRNAVSLIDRQPLARSLVIWPCAGAEALLLSILSLWPPLPVCLL